MEEIIEIVVLIYLLGINIAGYILMGMDKKKAIENEYRISEKTLFLVAILGGCFGTTIGMNHFRHKTKHWYFALGMPLISILWGYCLFRLFLI